MLGLVMVVFQGFANDLQNMQTAPGMADFQVKMQEFQRTLFVPNLIAQGTNLIVGTLLILGSVGVFGLKGWGRNLLRNTLLFAAIFVLLRGAYTAWVQYRTMDLMKGMMPIQGGDTATFEMAMQAGMIVSIVFGFVWVGALAGFYLWSRFYLNKDSVVALFDATK